MQTAAGTGHKRSIDNANNTIAHWGLSLAVSLAVANERMERSSQGEEI